MTGVVKIRLSLVIKFALTKPDFLWRGSANKIIRSPTGKYGETILEHWMQSPSAGISLALAGENVYFYGVPRKGALEKIKKELRKKGVLLNFSR